MSPTPFDPAPAAAAPTTMRYDVVIMGGGLAGLTLALQLRQQHPALDILVLERRRHPVPAAAHKVGESTVEIGAHYFSEVLGLRAHLDAAQIRKFGFRFFCSEGESALDRVTEIGASRHLSVPSWQIDRGLFENFLAEEAQRRGIGFVDGAMVRQLALDGETADASHRLQWEDGRGLHAAEARWVVDACGRAGLIKRQLGLAEPNEHAAHAVWFRIADRIRLDDWVDDPQWQSRCTPPARWQSTNHLVGAGYWVWLIPLSSGSHSVGIVADPRLHPLDTMDSFDKSMDWLRRYQPRLHADLEGKRDKLQDFAYFKRFSYGCKQVFSGHRWALTGEAGLFLDPFYSPGSDFIAIANTYITELIGRDLAGQPLDLHARLYDQLFHSFYESTMTLYVDQYPIFGHPRVLPVKVLWDYSYYWGVLAQLFFQRRLADFNALSALREALSHAQQLNRAVQRLLRDWCAHGAPTNAPRMLDQAALPWFRALNASLNDTGLDDAAFRQRLLDAVALLQRLAGEIADRAEAETPAAALQELRDALARGASIAAAGQAEAFAPGAGRLLFDDELVAA